MKHRDLNEKAPHFEVKTPDRKKVFTVRNLWLGLDHKKLHIFLALSGSRISPILGSSWTQSRHTTNNEVKKNSGP